MPKYDYNTAYFTKEDIENAEKITQNIIGHDCIESLLEMMISQGIKEIPWFRLSESERDIIRDYCRIEPKFRGYIDAN